MLRTAGISAPPVVVLRSEPEVIPEMARALVVALVVVELPVITRLEFMVEDANERKPPVRVEREVTPSVEERVVAPVTASVLWRVVAPVVVAPPLMVRPVVAPPAPMVVEAKEVSPPLKAIREEVAEERNG